MKPGQLIRFPHEPGPNKKAVGVGRFVPSPRARGRLQELSGNFRFSFLRTAACCFAWAGVANKLWQRMSLIPLCLDHIHWIWMCMGPMDSKPKSTHQSQTKPRPIPSRANRSQSRLPSQPELIPKQTNPKPNPKENKGKCHCQALFRSSNHIRLTDIALNWGSLCVRLSLEGLQKTG